MNGASDENAVIGVYAHDSRGISSLVHEYTEGDYGLEDIVGVFHLGTLISAEDSGPTIVEFSFQDLQKLKVLADAYSFDYEEGFIEMCLDMHRFGINESQERFQFTTNF